MFRTFESEPYDQSEGVRSSEIRFEVRVQPHLSRVFIDFYLAFSLIFIALSLLLAHPDWI